MGDMGRETHVFDAFALTESEQSDVAYHIAAQCISREQALDLAQMLDIGADSFRVARQEIWDHFSGQCPQGGHHGRPCWERWNR